MIDDDGKKDYEVGYGKPPKETRIRKGERRNPNGRRGKGDKPKAAKTDADIIAQIDNEMIEVGGRRMSKREAEIRVMHAKSLKGDMRAHQLLDSLRKSVKSAESSKSTGGVLLLPSPVSLEEWSAAAAISQARFRGEDPEGLAALKGLMND